MACRGEDRLRQGGVLTSVAAAWTLAVLAGLQGPSATVRGVVRLANEPADGAVVLLVPLEPGAVGVQPETALIDQRDLRFLPRVVVVTPGSSVQFANSDPLLHNVFSPRGPAAGFDLGTYQIRERRIRVFDVAGTHVILCHIHPEMVAYVVVAPTRYRVVLDGDGAFHLRDVPPGRYTLTVLRSGRVRYERVLSLQGGDHVQLRLDREPQWKRRSP